MSKKALLDILKEEKEMQYSGGIYHKTQIDFTYHSNRIEGCHLTHDQIRYMYETNYISACDEVLNVDDIVETANHFRCMDEVINHGEDTLSEELIKKLHGMLKGSSSDSRLKGFAVGEYKRIPNEVDGMQMVLPEEVPSKMQELVSEYNQKEAKTLEDILDFHVRFERIHPFQDGNGRVGRLIMFKECLKHGIVPFVIEDEMTYYRGLEEWDENRGQLINTILAAQEKYKGELEYFGIS